MFSFPGVAIATVSGNLKGLSIVVVVQPLSRVQHFVTPRTAAHEASMSLTISRSLLKLMSIESVMPSSHLILCHRLPLLPSVFPNIRVLSSESAFCIRRLKYWGFSFSISPSSEYLGWFPLGLTGMISLLSKGLSVFSSTTIWKHQFFVAQPSLWPNSHIGTCVAVQLLSCVWFFATLWTVARQASLSFTISQSLVKLTSIELVMPSNHLILCHPLLLPSIIPSIRVFSKESALPIRWSKYWSFSFSISPSNEHPGLISFRMDWLDLLEVQGTLKSLLQHYSSKYQFFGTQLSLWSNSHIHTWLLEKPQPWLDRPLSAK